MLLTGAAEFDIDSGAQLHGWRPQQRCRGQASPLAAGPCFIDRTYREPPHIQYDHKFLRPLEALTIIESVEEHGKKLKDLCVKIFATAADKAGMLEMYAKPFVKGLTTNPTLMRKAGITDYKAFSLDILKAFRTGRFRFECSPMSLPIWSVRRWRRELGQECLCQDSRDEHQAGNQLQADREARCQEGQV